jgi:uncharacterized protein (TIGR02231 family)
MTRAWIPVLIPWLVASCAGPASVAPTPRPHAKAPAPAAAEVAEASNAVSLASKVTEVTVYSDRARVTRRATAKLAADPTVFAFRKLPGWVDDGSIRVAASAGRIVDVRVERDFLARATDRTWQKAKEANEALKQKLEAIDDELGILAAQKQQIEAIKAFSLEKISKDAMLGNIKVATYGEVLTFIGNALRANASARREVQRRREQVAPAHSASERRLADLQSLMKLEETTVLVTLQGAAGASSIVDLTYLLPGATWEPMHDLRVATADGKTAEVISFAVVTQTSGEDWQDAKILFSTQSSSQSVRIPELEALTLGDTHTTTRTQTTKISSFLRAQTAYQQQNRLWNKVHQKLHRGQADFDQVYKSKLESLQVVQSKTVQIFESLQKRGTTAQFKATGLASVRGDGHPVRMLIGHGSFATDQKIFAAPEQSLNAARTLEMVNGTGQPFLPGKVALYQDGAFLGMTELDFVAAGERFSLFLSVADHLKLSRRLDRKHSSLVRKKRSKMQVAFIVTVENLSGQDASLTLADRIPVSENKEIKVDEVKLSAGARPDSRGIVRWNLTLKPKEKRELRIAYQVEYPAELILETRRRQAAQPAAANPYAPSPAPTRRKVEEQLMDLESQF